MVVSLSERLVYLRKEKGISQKQAALELNISQALLSHYERGIRECGLEFLMKVADYYGVTCDYLLGRTMEKHPEPAPSSGETENSSSAGAKDGISQSTGLLLDIAALCGSKELDQAMAEYLQLTIYKLFRLLYEAKDNPRGLLTLPLAKFPYAPNSRLTMCECKIAQLLSGQSCPGSSLSPVKKDQIPALTHDELQRLFPQSASTLLQVLHTADQLANEEN